MKEICNLENWKSVSGNTYEHNFPDSDREDSYFYHDGMFLENSRTYDLTKYFSLVFELESEEENEYLIKAGSVLYRDGKPEENECYHATVSTSETGVYCIEIPVDSFDIGTALSYNFRFVRRFSITGANQFQIRKAYLKPGRAIAVTAPVQGCAAEEKASYHVQIYNCSQTTQQVSLAWKRQGNEATANVYLPEKCTLLPEEKKDICIEVPVSQDIVPGGYETQTIRFTPNGKGMEREELVFYTAKSMRHPFVLMDEKELSAVREKIKTCKWAADNYEAMLLQEKEWQAPKIRNDRPFLFWSADAEHARCCATLYQLGASSEYKEKAIAFLKELSNPEYGYCKNPRACNQELVHEGEFFQNTAILYDFLYNEPELSREDHQNIEAVLRKFMNYIDEVARCGNISNWALLEIAGALYCACVLQDMKMVNRFLYDIGGFTDQLGKGTLSDGWWYEASIGYNLLAAGDFSMMTQVLLHFGIDLRYMNVPAGYCKTIDARKVLQDGLVIENWSENTKNYRNISMLWDSLVNFYDYRGVIFGINDSEEKRVEGTAKQLVHPRYDIAYYLYRKPEYAELLKYSKSEKRDLLFGVADLPEIGDSDRGKKSEYVDSAGACVLRSQKKGVPDRERIQAVLKYGSHGGAHGHYDRASLTNIMRYGRSLTSPQNIWYSYHTFLYKFYTQTSVNHNMLVVDLKQQEAVPPKRLLFHAGDMMQAAIIENDGRWSNPPYGGWQVNGDKTFRERCWNEGRYMEIPEVEPEYAVRTGFTEKVRTRRLVVVADDFIAQFDYGEGTEEHVFDCLYHLQGLRALEHHCDSAAKENRECLVSKRHTEKLDDSMLGCGQFISDCEWYEVEDGARLNFQTEFTEEKNNGSKWMCSNRTGNNEYGVVNTDLYIAYPNNTELIVGCDPEYQGVNKQLFYEVKADDDTVAEGSFGAWIFGRDRIDVDISGKHTLELRTKVSQVLFEEAQYLPMEKSIFWGNPKVQLTDGSWKNLSDLKLDYQKVDPGYGIGIDYKGGPVKISAKLFNDAIPAEPEEADVWGSIHVDLGGLDAVRLVAEIGGDYPVGDESGRRRTAAIRQRGTNASFITVLEPVETEHVIERVYAENGKKLEVFLKDGRRTVITVDGLEGADGTIKVRMEEWNGNTLLRFEETGGKSVEN